MDKVIFIDRDGVINKDPAGWTKHSYVTRWEEFLFIEGSVEALKMLKTAGYKIFLISNQGGVSKGYFTENDLAEINRKMLAEVEKGGGKIDGLFYCVHHDKDNCECRKPKAGLIEQAAKNLRIDFKNTYIIGDSLRDIEAGRRMGMKTIFVASGKTSLPEIDTWSVKPDYIKKNLLEAVKQVVGEV